MLVYTADEHAIFLDEAKSGGGFSGAGEDASVPGRTDEG